MQQAPLVQPGRMQAGVANLGEFVAVLGLQVALHIGHELVEAGGQVGLPVPRVRGHYPVPQRGVDLQAQRQPISPSLHLVALSSSVRTLPGPRRLTDHV